MANLWRPFRFVGRRLTFWWTHLLTFTRQVVVAVLAFLGAVDFILNHFGSGWQKSTFRLGEHIPAWNNATWLILLLAVLLWVTIDGAYRLHVSGGASTLLVSSDEALRVLKSQRAAVESFLKLTRGAWDPFGPDRPDDLHERLKTFEADLRSDLTQCNPAWPGQIGRLASIGVEPNDMLGPIGSALPVNAELKSLRDRLDELIDEVSAS
jgi:hypothetical protein